MLVPAKKKNLFAMSAIILGFWIFTVSAAESIYKWVDEDGSVHYSDQPPGEATKSEKLRIESTPSNEVVRDAQAKRDRLKTEQQSRVVQLFAAREQERLQTESEQMQRDDRQRRCTKAHEQIQSLNHHMPIYYIDESRNRAFLDDKKRADLIAFYHRDIAMFCD